MKMKKFLLVFLALVIAMTSIVFASCNQTPAGPSDDKNQGNGDGDQNGNDLDATPTPVRDENNLFIWWDQGAADVSLLQDAWYDFSDLYAGKVGPSGKQFSKEINMFHMDGDENGTTMLEQQVMAGTAPDVVRMDHVYITALGQKGLVFDLQEKWQATDKISDQFIASTWEASSSFDRVYGIPFDANTIIFGARTSILEQAGVSMPTTYDELRTVGAKIKALNLDQNVYTLPCGTDARYNWPAFVFMFWVWRLGGDVLNEDMTQAIFNDTETGVEALNMMLQLQEDGLISATAYEEGNTVMCDYGTWWMNGLQEDMTLSLQLKLKDDVPQYSGLGLYDLAIVTTAKNPELAYDFAVHFATGKNSVSGDHYVYTFCKAHNLIPSCIEAAETGGDYTTETKNEFWRLSVEQLELSKYRPPVACWPEIEEAISTAVTQAIQGEKAPKEALNAAAALANQLLEEEAKTRK